MFIIKYTSEFSHILLMKVLMINGSPHTNGCTARALSEVENVLEASGIEVKRIEVGNKDVRGCIGCHFCREHGRCVFKTS